MSSDPTRLPPEVPDAPEPFTHRYFKASGFDFEELEPAEIEVKLPREFVKRFHLENRRFIAREAGTEAARQYKNSAMRAAKMKDASVVGVDGLADSEIVLVTLCLFEIRDDVTENGKPQEKQVTPSFVKSLPNRVSKPLFDWVKHVSDLGEEDDTLERLDKEQEQLDRRRKRMLKKTATGEDPVSGKEPSGMTDSSA